MRNINKSYGGKIPMNDEWAETMWHRFLKRTENMSYEDAEREILPFLGWFEATYPERCPKKEVVSEPIHPQFKEKPKSKKSQKNENQPSLFQ